MSKKGHHFDYDQAAQGSTIKLLWRERRWSPKLMHQTAEQQPRFCCLGTWVLLPTGCSVTVAEDNPNLPVEQKKGTYLHYFIIFFPLYDRYSTYPLFICTALFPGTPRCCFQQWAAVQNLLAISEDVQACPSLSLLAGQVLSTLLSAFWPAVPKLLLSAILSSCSVAVT